MIVEQIWTEKAWRNINYLVACEETGEALAIDPLDHGKCLARAKDAGLEIRQILNTHEHFDHIGGNEALRRATGAKILAHANAKDAIDGLDVGLAAKDVVRVGKTVELEVLDTPGHTMSHVCLLSHGDTVALFSGDTLFNAGAGNCHNGGHPEVLFTTFSRQLAVLQDETLVYPGHDYIVNNLGFTLDREPDNARAQELLGRLRGQDPADAMVSTLGLEREINTFFRLRSPSVIAHLRERLPHLPDEPDERTVFLALRELRNAW